MQNIKAYKIAINFLKVGKFVSIRGLYWWLNQGRLRRNVGAMITVLISKQFIRGIEVGEER